MRSPRDSTGDIYMGRHLKHSINSNFVIKFHQFKRFFSVTNSKLKRLNSISESPIFSLLTETINGINSIKAYKVESSFIKEIEDRIDENNKYLFALNYVKRWLCVYIEILANSISIFFIIFAFVGKENLSPGLVGLTLTYSLEVITFNSKLFKLSKS